MKATEIELTKVTLEPGETLFVKITAEEITGYALEALGKELRDTFPNNKVVLFAMGPNDDIQLTKVMDVSYTQQSKELLTGNQE